jgi:hypothetical protein
MNRRFVPGISVLMRRDLWLLVALAGLGPCLVLGCSKKTGMPTAPVVGKVTYRGKPVPTGTVMFTPDEGPAATGNIAPDGTYRLTTYREGDGAVIGRHKVTITALQDMGNLLPEQRSPTPPPLVPVKYLSAETSGLTAEVKPDVTNTIDFHLKD